MLSGFIENAIAWDSLLQDGLFHLSGKVVVAGPTFLWPTELLLAGLFIIILFGIFLLGSAVIHRFDKREMSLVEDQLREIRVVEAQLAERTKDLERSNHDLAQFAYVASHDLRAPVRAMKSFAQILVDDYSGKLDEEADEHLGFIVDGANRLESLINDLLAYSRIDTQGRRFEPVDCSAIFDQVKTDLIMDADHAEAEVTRDALPSLIADGTQMGQLFQNLISNGLKFHGESSPVVHMSAEKNEKEWLFSVRDNGIGIEPEHAERIFAMFQRLHTQEEYPGTGMGSAICKKIVERHGGKIWVNSEIGAGSTFFFTIETAGAR
jgi:light-regulated signal transduction histidine kinase (bacteriophytochrome)